VLRENSWTHLAQEVLVRFYYIIKLVLRCYHSSQNKVLTTHTAQISTPRRFGKTISVSQFAAAMLFAAPQVEISIYSTCKRISQKLLRNVQKFFMLLCAQDPAAQGFRVIRQNMEEVVMGGPDGVADVRVVNSYPSKVGLPDQSRP
jgi:hypothetical protein